MTGESLFSSGAFALEPVLALDAPITGLTGNVLGGIWVIVSFAGLAATVAATLGMHIGIHAKLVATVLFG